MTPRPGDPLRYVFVEAPRCPACGSARHVKQRTHTEADGTRRRSVKCKICGHNFVIIVEAPIDEEILPSTIQPVDGCPSTGAILGAQGDLP